MSKIIKNSSNSGKDGVVLNSGKDGVICNSNKEVPKGSVLPRRKHNAKKRYRGTASGRPRGVKIVDTEEGREGTSYENYGIPPTPEVNKVQKALESSSLELQAVVKDPLPDALHLAKTVMSRMARKNMDHEPEVRDHYNSSSNEPNPPVDNKAEAVRSEGDLGNPGCSNQNDSIGSFPEESPNRGRRPHLPSPKPKVGSPLKKYETMKLAKRRTAKKWSNVEEETLRTGVKMFGHRNWKLILNKYSNVFEGRTTVDLKDKWRNLTR